MANKNTGVGRTNSGDRVDQQIVGREAPTQPEIDRAAEYASPNTSAGTSDTPREPDTETRTREIRAEIEQTREDLSDTLSSIQERFRPSTVAANAVDTVREAASERAREIGDSEPVQYARANPVPSAMVGLGLVGAAWLAFGGRDRYQYRRISSRSQWRGNPGRSGATGTLAGRRGMQVGEYDADARSYMGRQSLYETSADAYGGTDIGRRSRAGRSESDQYGEYGEYGRETMRRAKNQLQRTWDQNPLLIGAAVGLIGAIVGSLVPETDRENELLGPARDSTVQMVEQAVQNKVEQVQNAATNAVNEVQKAVGIASTDESTSTTRPSSSGENKRGGPGSTPR